MKDPLISIIIPVYNTIEYLENCLDSVISQTYKNIEILLIDDGSLDGSDSLCDRYAENDSRIKVVHQKNAGVSKARNVALDKVSGEYICFVDSDDTINENLILHLYTTMLEKNADITICSHKTICENVASEKVFSEVIEYSQKDALKDILLTTTFTGSPWAKLFKTERIKNIYFDDDIFYGEDMLFVVKAMMKAEKVVFTPKAYYNYFVRDGSACKSSFNDKRYTDVLSRKRIYDEISHICDCELIELAHVSIILADIIMLQQLYYDKKAQRKYCKDIQNRIRENFKVSRLNYVDLSVKINMVTSFVSYKLFFLLLFIKKFLKGK